jgi:hypothetical protein
MQRRLEQLRSLGYVAWDKGADTRLTGVTRFDVERTAPGYNLYSDLADQVHLTNLKGEKIHTWRVKGGKQCQHGVLRPDGSLVMVCFGHGLVAVDWNSEVLLDFRMPAHHDITPLPDGGYLLPYGEMKTYKGRRVIFDGIATISAMGKVVNRWSTFAHLPELQKLHAPSELDKEGGAAEGALRADEQELNYYHLNTVEVLPETPLGKKDPRFKAGNLLVCFRNVNLLAVLDPSTYAVQWSWGEKILDLPHTPTMTANGNILVFDNGAGRGYSRVLEIEPVRGEIVWKYQGTPPESFYSKYCGSAQRLPNGDTLILDSWRGRAFEVTAKGEVVWEFWGPEIVGDMRKRIYRFNRLPPAVVEPLIKRFGPDAK